LLLTTVNDYLRDRDGATLMLQGGRPKTIKNGQHARLLGSSGREQSMVKTNAPTLVGPDLTINGDLESPGDIQIDGMTDGGIRCQNLVVAASAVVRGTIIADAVLIAGQFTGEIKARDVVFGKSARVTANILQEKLTIEYGAFFEGTCSVRRQRL
jgi:cytoskeletal protein CcmA (bactofilin family)